MQDVEEMKQIASEVRMETVLDLLGLDRPNSGHKIPSINNPDETVPSLHIYEYDWYDFSSGEGGDQITFVQRFFNCNFWRALTFICQADGMDGPTKQIVNQKPVWDSFLEYLDETITLVHKRLEQEVDVEKIYRAQGEIAALRRLKYMRDEFNNDDKTKGFY